MTDAAPLPQIARDAAAEALFWLPGSGEGTCPVCARVGAMDELSHAVLRDARLALSGARQTPLAYLRCGACGTVFAPAAEALDYATQAGGEDALRYYLEEGAGIDLLTAPLRRLDRAGIRQYAEIGCAFGFSLDFARLCLGWDVRGIDPSPLAEAGREALGLPIELRYFNEAQPLPDPRVDVLQAAEVIEHVADPREFMRALVAALADEGILIVSTPNAAALRPGTPDAVLLQVLQPGVHLCLFTEAGLGALAKEFGLTHQHAEITADDVTLYAARHPFALHPQGGADRAPYLDYLRRRLSVTPASAMLRRGLRSRLIRELTRQGGFGEMDALLPDLFADFATSGVDLRDPAGLVRRAGAPFGVGAMLLCLGLREINGGGDRARGIAYLDACVSWQAADAAPLAIAGVADASAADLAWLAARAAESARIEDDPAAAHDRGLAARRLGELSLFDRRLLFAALVNRGDYLRAAVHSARVAATIDTADDSASAHPSGRPLGTIGHDAMTRFTLGIFALNHLGDRPAARRWFAAAAELSSRDPALDHVRCQAVLALHRAGDPVEMGNAVNSPVKAERMPTGPRAGAGGNQMRFARNLLSRLTGKPRGGPAAVMPRAAEPQISFADLSEAPDPSLLPPLDRPDVDETGLTPEQRAWRRDGLLILPKFLPDWLTDPYIARRAALDSPGGWLSAAPYLHVPELRALALYPPLMRVLESLIGETMLLHLALTPWISTERNWHQDDYLNPPFVNSWYLAVWMALDRIDPASGPFEWVPGSHRWPLMRGEKVRSFLTEAELSRQEAGVNHWPKYAERFVTPAIDHEIARQGATPRTFLAQKGDVLIWHGRLMHRGSAPRQPGMERRSLITHYSGVNHRPDMISRAGDENGQNYAVFDIPLH